MRKNVLELTPEGARRFFLSPPIYSTFDLPKYFSFRLMITFISNQINGITLNLSELNKAEKVENVNHHIYHNKNGKYAWRKLQLINPYLYVSLVNCITEKVSWNVIINRFRELSASKSFKCMSIPVLADIKQNQNATQISEWIENIEKESIRLALDYEYIYQTDIINCYGSIYTHSIAWALHGKAEAKKKRGFDELIGNRIDCHLQAMSNGQTNGVPQGSKLMDFIVEILLAYIDDELLKKINEMGNIKEDEYFILRYRDDYRIFVRNPFHGEIIMKILSETLAEVGMNMNTSKIMKNEKIIVDSFKSDKLKTINQPLIQKVNYKSIRNELIFIYKLGIEYPNCGQVITRLTEVNNAVDSKAQIKILQHDYVEFISILINIAFDNPKSFPVAAALISKAILNLRNNEKQRIIDKLIRKIQLLPNSGILEIWLQRITIKHGYDYKFKEALCRVASGKSLKLFNTNWISDVNIRKGIDKISIIDRRILRNLDRIISKKEVDLFAY